ncbi:MAG: segregation and condensation protein A [Thermodesulfobacteriota bacterium]
MSLFTDAAQRSRRIGTVPKSKTMDYKVKLDVFEGPMDLLLHLIKKHEIDIYDIPIATITEQYLEYINLMRSLNLDIAGEFLVMASTLIHIKSKMLLPPSEDEDDEDTEDPRDELVQNLLEYQRYKEGAKLLDESTLLGRDIFARSSLIVDLPKKEEQEIEELESVSIITLLEAFKEVLERVSADSSMDIEVDRLSIADRIKEIMERLNSERVVDFCSIFKSSNKRSYLILTFIALLELLRQRLVRVEQSIPFGKITIYLPGVDIDG